MSDAQDCPAGAGLRATRAPQHAGVGVGDAVRAARVLQLPRAHAPGGQRTAPGCGRQQCGHGQREDDA